MTLQTRNARRMPAMTPSRIVAAAILLAAFSGAHAFAADRVVTASGPVDGTKTASGIRLFRGLPFAAPPVRELRWRPPQPVGAWTQPLEIGRASCRERV